MSERSGEPFDIYTIPGMNETVLELVEKYGIERHEAEDGIRLAISMKDVLNAYEGPIITKNKHWVNKEVKKLFTKAAQTTPGVLLDKFDRPLPRYTYVASSVLGETLEPDAPFYNYFAGISQSPMVPHFANTKAMLDDLIPLLVRKEHPYSQPEFILPEDPINMPQTPFVDKRQEANFFVTACLWMRRTDSNKAMRDISRAFDETRGMDVDLFEPNDAKNMSPDQVWLILRKYKQLKMLGSNARGLVHNMRFISEVFGGDIRNAFAGTVDYDEIYLRLKNSVYQDDPSRHDPRFGNGLYGFREKMGSMLIYYEDESGCIEPIDYPPPIDQHLARLAAGTGSVQIRGDYADKNIMNEALQAILRDLYYDISCKYTIKSSHIAQALWLMGSKNCSNSPVTFSTVVSLDGRNSVITEYEPDYTWLGPDTKAYYRTCGSCPLNSPINPRCTHTSSGKQHHLKGSLKLFARSDVPQPSDYMLFGGVPEWEEATSLTVSAGRLLAALRRVMVNPPQYKTSQLDRAQPQQERLF